MQICIISGIWRLISGNLLMGCIIWIGRLAWLNRVKIRIPDGMDRNRMMLYHIKDQAQEVIFEIVGDDVVFEASSFSPYVLVELRETQPVDPSKPVQPRKTPTKS